MARKVDPIIKQVADQLIEMIEKGTAPWQCGWDKVIPEFPTNATTGKCYNGINALILFAAQQKYGYTDSRWVTFKQVLSKHGKVKKGEHGIKCVFFGPHEFKNTDEDGNEYVKKSFVLNRFVVFNVQQTEGVDWNKDISEPHIWEPIETAEKIITNSKAVIEHKRQNQAFYSPSEDKIVLPERTQFIDNVQYYDTVLHELGHWTGHKSRLNRPTLTKFGTEEYAKEELVAEIASMMISSTIKIAHNSENHAAYCKSWIKVLKDDPTEIMRAASKASKVKDYLIKFAE